MWSPSSSWASRGAQRVVFTVASTGRQRRLALAPRMLTPCLPSPLHVRASGAAFNTIGMRMDLALAMRDLAPRVFDAMFMEFAELWQPYPTFGRRGEVVVSSVAARPGAFQRLRGRRWALLWVGATMGSPHADARSSDDLSALMSVAILAEAFRRLSLSRDPSSERWARRRRSMVGWAMHFALTLLRILWARTGGR